MEPLPSTQSSHTYCMEQSQITATAVVQHLWHMLGLHEALISDSAVGPNPVTITITVDCLITDIIHETSKELVGIRQH